MNKYCPVAFLKVCDNKYLMEKTSLTKPLSITYFLKLRNSIDRITLRNKNDNVHKIITIVITIENASIYKYSLDILCSSRNERSLRSHRISLDHRFHAFKMRAYT
jgi:DNA helicase TIP49 (TBP-interacting protein)